MQIETLPRNKNYEPPKEGKPFSRFINGPTLVLT